ncbi:MAG: sigma-70 family RNA polymerase sigma factor [Lachnospiraceae bacterium]|jgi:RNA polymerase sigma-70 factor (ECF subfamily)|nr:sigma-70 family RNA polymerase sigma factor [Lachnospiraceae bacterium]
MELEEQYDHIYRYCYFRLRDAGKAEDITQETFLRYLESDSYRDTGRPLAFLYTVARNLCIDEMRRKKMESLPEELPGENKEDSMLDAIMLRQALHDLDSEERELILLRYVNEVPVADMAKIYGKSRYALYRETKKILQKLERRMTHGQI